MFWKRHPKFEVENITMTRGDMLFLNVLKYFLFICQPALYGCTSSFVLHGRCSRKVDLSYPKM